MPDETPFAPDATLGLIGPGWWLSVSCACGRRSDFPVRMMLRQHGPRATGPELLARMRCGGCRARPAEASYIDNPAGGALGSGYPPPRRVPLSLPAAPAA